MTDLTARLPLERMKDIVDRALRAERGLDGSDPRLRTYANARARVEREFWGRHAALLAEITRLTSEVERLEKYNSVILEEHFEMADHLSEHASPNQFAGVKRYEKIGQVAGDLADIVGQAIEGGAALTNFRGDG